MDLGHRHVLTASAVVAALAIAGGAAADVVEPVATSAPAVVAPAAPAAAPNAAPETSPANAAMPAPIAHAVIGPVLTSEGASGKGDREIPLRKVSASDAFAIRAREVELALRDAAQDLGLSLDFGSPLPSDGVRDADLVAAATGGRWVVSPRIEAVSSDEFVLRMVAVPPGSPTLLVRTEKVEGAQLSLRATVMLRDFVQMKLGTSTSAAGLDPQSPPLDDEARRSRGRPVLAVSSSLFGLYAAFAIHRAAGRDDPRLLYPLLALGAGAGLGASLLVADEWDVTPGDAWTIAAGSWWGVVAGSSWAVGRDVRPADDRFAWGLLGGLGGTTAAAAWTAVHRFDDGGATLVHSGAALGTFVGSMSQWLARGSFQRSGASGASIGAGAGFLAGGALAMVLKTSSQRVMLVDLGAGLGALAGASVASPLVFKDETAGKTRLFIGSVLAGTAIGGAVSWLFTREPTAAPTSKDSNKGGSKALRAMPFMGPLGTRELPAYGGGVFGSF